jgi:mono/diheme cytochrome c family protein
MLFVMGVAACGGSGDAGPQGADPANGKTVYDGLCIACHGADGTGVEGLGKDLTTSEFFRSLSEQELVEFIIEGRPSTHPDNTTGVDMPPRGGKLDLTEEEILDVIAYVNSLQK